MTREAARALVFLHGHDDDPAAFVAVARSIVASRGVAIVPRGPLATDAGRAAWFESDGGEPDPDQLEGALNLVDHVVHEAAAAHGITPAQVVVAGFSQGAAVALAWLLRATTTAPAVGAVGAVAGWLVHAERLTLDLDRAAGIPILVAHGEDDEVVPLPLGRSAAKALARHGAAVTTIERETGHELDPFVDDLRDWFAALG